MEPQKNANFQKSEDIDEFIMTNELQRTRNNILTVDGKSTPDLLVNPRSKSNGGGVSANETIQHGRSEKSHQPVKTETIETSDFKVRSDGKPTLPAITSEIESL